MDTNVVSELRKGRRCDPGGRRWLSGVVDDDLYLSVVTIGELRRGVERVLRRDEAAGRSLERWLSSVSEDHADRILAVDRRVAEVWGRMGVPDPLPVIDGLLAATAHVHGLTLVTRNVEDVESSGVPFLDPFWAEILSELVDPRPGEAAPEGAGDSRDARQQAVDRPRGIQGQSPGASLTCWACAPCGPPSACSSASRAPTSSSATARVGRKTTRREVLGQVHLQPVE